MKDQMVKGFNASRATHRRAPVMGLRPSPARDQVRLTLDRLMAEGTFVFTAESLASSAGVSLKVVKPYLGAAVASRMAVPLVEVLDLKSSAFCLSEAYPGAPTDETIAMATMLTLAKGLRETSQAVVAFGYGTALQLHGLTEVAIPGFHLVKTTPSIHVPLNRDVNQPFQRRSRRPTEWTRHRGGSPVFLTIRPWEHLPAQEIQRIPREGTSLRVTSPIRTLVDAWMHPDWCGGEDRVLDSWRMFWARKDADDQQVRHLAMMLVQTTWPGLWQELSQWAASNIPALKHLPDLTRQMQGIFSR